MRFLGTDIALGSDGDIKVVNGDIAIVEGVECLKENLKDRLFATQGDLVLHPEFGLGIHDFVSLPPTSNMKFELRARVKFQLLEDPRVREVNALEIEEDYGALTIKASIVTQDGQVIGNLVFPFEVGT